MAKAKSQHTTSEIEFKCSKLEAAIRKDLNKPKVAISRKDMASLKKLEAVTNDLTGLEYATNLTELHIKENSEIADLTPLARLTKLTKLDLRWNQIANLNPLAKLTNLTELDLRENKIADLTPLSGLTNLTELYPAEYNRMRYGRDDVEDIQDRFIGAVKSGDADTVRDLIAKEVDLRSTDDNGTTAWELAATAGHHAVVKLLKNAVSDLGELLADPGSGHSMNAPCPICGVFDDVFEPTCGHFIGAIYEGDIIENTDYLALDDIVIDVVDAVNGYIHQGVAQLSAKWDKEGRKMSRNSPWREFMKTIMQSVPKSLAPAIKGMEDYGKGWWISGRGVKKGVCASVEHDSYVGYYHPNVTLFARRQKDKALKVLKWLEKRGYVPDH